MIENPQAPPISDTDRLAAILAELERERQKRVNAGQWSKGARPRLMALPADGETQQAGFQSPLVVAMAEALRAIPALPLHFCRTLDRCGAKGRTRKH